MQCSAGGKMLVLTLAMYLGAVFSIHGQVNRKDFATKEVFDDVTKGTNDTGITVISLGTPNVTAKSGILADFADVNADHDDYDSLESLEPEEFGNNTFTIFDLNTNLSYNFRENDSVPAVLTNENIDNVNVTENVSFIELGDFNLGSPVISALRFCRIKNACDSENVSVDANYCCIPCKCYSTCMSHGPCCHLISKDEFHMNTYTEECLVPSIGDKSMYIGSLSKRLINSCDVSAEIGTIKKCKQLENDITELRQFIPVNSHRSMKSYKNIYCAECNNENAGSIAWQLTPIKSWETHLICKNGNLLIEVLEKVFYKSGNIIDKFNTTKGCYLHWQTNRETEMCIKRSNVIQSCSDPNFGDEQAIEFCRKAPYHPVKGIYGIYRNLYCLICNEGFDVINGICMSPFYDIHERHDASRVALRLPQSIVDVLDALDNGLPPPSPSFNNDKIQKMCPITSITAGSTCVVVMNELKGIGLDFLVKITFSEQIPLNVSDSEISANVKSLILDDDDVMILCVVRVLDRYEDGSKTMAVVQHTLKSVDFVDLRDEYAFFKKRVESLNRKARNFARPFTVELTSFPLELIYDSSVSFATYSAAFISNECGRSVAMTDLQFCETFMFKRVLHSGKDMIEVNGIPFTAGEFLKLGADHSVLICRDLYTSRKKQAKKLAVFSSTNSNEPKLAAFVIGMLIGCVFVKFNTKP